MPDTKDDLLKDVEIPLRDIDFQVDTIKTETDTGGYFSPSSNSLTVNFKPDKDAWNEWTESDNVLIHEQKHRDNTASGFDVYAVSPEQAYKLNMHNEISANMASLLLLRQQYIENGDISIFEKEEQGRFSFYGAAVKSGEIKPGSPYKEDFDKEMSLIANGTRDMWEEKFARGYNDISMSYAKYKSDKSGKYAKYYDENYQRGMRIAYTIGGVDFTKYMNRDVEIPENGKFDLKVLAADGKDYEAVTREFDLPVFDGSMSLEQYKKLLQHKMTMDHFTRDGHSLNIVGANQAMLETQQDAGTQAFAKRGLDRSKNEYSSASKEINNELIDTIINSVAKDYGVRGEKLPEANDEAYNRAVDQLYTRHVKIDGDFVYDGEVNLRQSLVDEKMFDGKLPEYAQSVQNTDGWTRTVAKWSHFVGMPDEMAQNIYNNTKDANPFLKYVGGAGACIIAPFASAVANGKEWIDSLKDKEKVENVPIYDVNTKAPQYRKWENKDGGRVSEVQYRKLPDLRQEIIRKPTKSYAAEKQEEVENAQQSNPGKESVNRVKMTHILEYMNKINGRGKQVDAAATVDALCDKYGDQAYRLMLTAVNEPYNYAKIAGDNSITTSRAAVNHLCSLTGKDELKMTNHAREEAGLPPLSEPRKTNGKERANVPQPTEAKAMNKLVESAGRGHERIAALRAQMAERNADRFVLLNDNTRVAADHLRHLRYERAGQGAPVRPTAISAEMLREKLAAMQKQ